jgi:hypothetical protein
MTRKNEMFDTHSYQPAPLQHDSPMASLDSETACLLRISMLPEIDAASDWKDLETRLGSKGFGLTFRDGRMIFVRLDDGQEICTGRFLGVPMTELADRLGRPNVRAGRDGRTGRLIT